MAPRDVVRAINAGRVALGVGLLVAPRRSGRGWIGDDARLPGVAVVARAHGSREVLLGGLALHTAANARFAARMQHALAAVDAVDLVATLAARRSLPRTSIGVGLIAAIALAGELWAAPRLAQPGSSAS
jgi:hypothetical protein